MSGPNPPGREPEEPGSASGLSREPESGGDPGDESEPDGEVREISPYDALEPLDDSAEIAGGDHTGQTDAYSRAYSAPESEQFTSGPYVPADPRLYDYDGYDESAESDDEQPPRAGRGWSAWPPSWPPSRSWCRCRCWSPAPTPTNWPPRRPPRPRPRRPCRTRSPRRPPPPPPQPPTTRSRHRRRRDQPVTVHRRRRRRPPPTAPRRRRRPPTVRRHRRHRRPRRPGRPAPGHLLGDRHQGAR